MRLVFSAVATVILVGTGTVSATCPPGRYTVRGPLLIAGGQLLRRDTVVLDGNGVRIDSGCSQMSGTITNNAEVERITAHWDRCGQDSNVVLEAHLDPACRTMRGTVSTGPGVARRFSAIRSRVMEPVPCGFPLPFGQRPENVQCVTMQVPERHGTSSSRHIELAIAVLKATGPAPRREPLVFVNGGPGGATLPLLIQAFPAFAATVVQSTRDIIFVDLRGTGLSRPSLGCPEYTAALAAGVSQDSALGAVAICHDRLAETADLSAYNSTESARDLRDLVRALGYAAWDVEGLSYGSRVALLASHARRSGLRATVLDSPAPWNKRVGLEVPSRFQALLHTLFQACAADPACAVAAPDVEDTFYRLVTQLNTQPITVDLSDATGARRARVVSGDALLGIVQAALFDYRQLRKIPAVVQRVAAGHTEALGELPGRDQTAAVFQWGAFFSTWCAEEVLLYEPGDVDRATATLRPELKSFSRHAIEFLIAACGRWRSVNRPASIARAGGPIRHPVLLIEGDLDANAVAPSYVTDIASLAPGAFTFTLRGQPHAVSFNPVTDYFAGRPPCGLRLVGEFLDDPAQHPLGACVDALPAVTFDQ